MFRLQFLPANQQAATRNYQFPWGAFEYLSAGNLRAQYKEIYLLREYAFDCDKVRPVIVDCGGNVGLSVTWFKQHYPDSQIVVYEPDPDIAEVLKRNISRLRLSDVSVRPTAVWTEQGNAGFQRGSFDTGGLSGTAKFTVPTIRLADELPEHVDLLKLDIEGAEFAVLDDLFKTKTLTRIRKLIAECHVTRDKVDAFIELLAKLRSDGMEIAVGSARPTQALGHEPAAAPFPALMDSRVLVELYAWRN